MKWNYRIIDHGDWLGLHEVYYADDGSLSGYTENAITFVADIEEGPDGIIGGLRMALEAGAKPVLKPADFRASQ